MTPDDDVFDSPFWGSGVAPGAAATWLFSGADGLGRLSGPHTFSAPAASAFFARLTRVQLDHVALDAFAASAHRSNRGEHEIVAHPTPLLSFVFLSEGHFTVELSDARFSLEAGQFIVVDSREPIRYTATEDVRLLMTSVGIEHVPPYLREQGMTIPGPLVRTPLTDSFLAFASSILRSAAIGRPAHGAELIQATADLQSAVLAEAQRVTRQPTGAAGVRYRMEEYIEAHLTDPDLTPGTIADALQISVRHAHNVFNDDKRTITRYIRDRKIDRIAIMLRTSRDGPELLELATRFGFPSLESMSRAFRTQIGMSPSEYRAGGHRALG